MASLMKNQLWVAVFMVVLLLVGCATQVTGPKSQATPKERPLVAGQKTVVFLRMKGFLENKVFDEVPLMSGPDEKGFAISLRPQGGSATPMFMQLHRVDSGETGQKGWVYFLSDPGNYELEFVQHMGIGQKALSPSFILRVPPQKSLVYAGSVSFYCQMKGGLWAPTLGGCQDIMVTDEGNIAQIMVKPLRGESGQAFMSILERKGDRVPPASSRNWFPMGLATSGTKEMGAPDWVIRGVQRTTGLSGAVPADQLVTGIAQSQWIGLAYLLYLPVGVSLGAICGKKAEKKWQPCLQRLAREIQQSDPTKLLRQELQGELSKFSPMPPLGFESPGVPSQEVTRRNLRSILEVEVTRILMRESRERGTFSLEIALKASLSELPGKSAVYEAELVYTNPDPVIYTGKTPQNKAAATLKISPCRNLATYCGPEGGKILQEDLLHGIHYLVERLLWELGFFAQTEHKQYSSPVITPVKKIYSHR